MRTRSASPRPACRATRTGGRRSRVAPVSSRACFGERERGYTVSPRAPVAQGIERCPAEAEVASSNLAGRMVALLAEDGVADAGQVARSGLRLGQEDADLETRLDPRAE